MQATDRLGMIQSIWPPVSTSRHNHFAFGCDSLVFPLAAFDHVAFLGESHFAFLSYAKNFRQTPARSQLDHLCQLGGSKEAAKELKLFHSERFLHEALHQDLERHSG